MGRGIKGIKGGKGGTGEDEKATMIKNRKRARAGWIGDAVPCE